MPSPGLHKTNLQVSEGILLACMRSHVFVEDA